MNILARRKLYTNIERLLSDIVIDFGGGCSLPKAYIMACLIATYRLKTTLDIGVYRGRSLFPQALAHKYFTGGVVYGIDPWDNEVAQENDNLELRERIKAFLQQVSLKEIGAEVIQYKTQRHLDDHCIIIPKKSEEAAEHFRHTTFGLIHIDGSHDTEVVMNDIELYLPLLSENGFLVMDDMSWECIQPAIEVVKSKCSLLYSRTDSQNDYAVFWNGTNEKERNRLALELTRILADIQRFSQPRLISRLLAQLEFVFLIALIPTMLMALFMAIVAMWIYG